MRLLRGADVRQVGREPDYRFSLANERTFLAWIRTALALDAAGLAILHLLPPFRLRGGREVLGTLLVALGAATAALSFRRWARNERAIRTDSPLPVPRTPAVIAVGVTVISLLAAVFVLAGTD
ncbi:MAG: YidH family protein [Egibacteraceae bacterium]